jgi:hypothetical protein
MNHESLQQIANFSPIAYLDGGSGSLLFQMVIASSLTALYTVKMQWKTLVLAIRKLRDKNSK